jgi:hypothetical protein
MRETCSPLRRSGTKKCKFYGNILDLLTDYLTNFQAFFKKMDSVVKEVE